MKEYLGSFKTKQAAQLAFARELKNEGYNLGAVKSRIEFNNSQFHLYIIID